MAESTRHQAPKISIEKYNTVPNIKTLQFFGARKRFHFLHEHNVLVVTPIWGAFLENNTK